MYYWFKDCPRCRQGRLFIMRMCETGNLYLHCEECETAWADPDHLDDLAEGKLGVDLDSEYASDQEIAEKGWRSYALNASAE